MQWTDTSQGRAGQGDETPGETARRLGLLALVVCTLIGLPLALAAVTGSLGIPHNDAWSHSKIAQTYAETGRVTLLGWNRSAIVGQVVVLGPFAASVTAQHLFVAACGAVCLLMTYLLVRPRAGAKAALLAAVTLGVVPEFGLLATSFMTDIPSLAGVLTCLWAGDEAIRRNSLPYWWLSVAVGLWAITVREQSVVAPAAVLVAGWLTSRPARSHRLLAAVVIAAGLAGFQVWRRSLPADDPPAFEMIPLEDVGIVALQGLVTLGLFLLPTLAAVANPVRWRPATRALTAGAVVLLVGAWVALDVRGSLLLGNYLGRQVSYASTSFGAPVALPASLWWVVLLAAVLGTILLVGQVLECGLPKDPLLLTAGALLLVGTLATALLGQTVFGRYLLLFVPIGAGLLLPRRAPQISAAGRTHRPAVRLGLGTAVLPLVVGLVLTAATYSYDGARWAAATALVEDGVPPEDIDAGLEWVGSHARGPLVPNTDPEGPPGGWWMQFESSRACYLISGDPAPGEPADRTLRYPAYGIGGSDSLYVYLDRC